MNTRKKMTKQAMDFDIYRFVFETAIEIFEEIFETSKKFPKDKTFLIDQVRKYSKLVCIHLAEAWRVKKNKMFFVSKLSDAAQAASKAQIWLEYASRSNYIDKDIFKKIDARYEDIFEVLCCSMKN